MTGEIDLTTLIRGLSPRLDDEQFAFGLVPHGQGVPEQLGAVGTFQEDEGLTVIAPASRFARTSLEHSPGWAKITLEVHSSLAAVGLLAEVARTLASEGISTNPVAGFYHDHIFVPWAKRHRALELLTALARHFPQDRS